MQETHQSSVNATRVHSDMGTQCTRTQVCTCVYIRLYIYMCACVYVCVRRGFKRRREARRKWEKEREASRTVKQPRAAL